ncbi:MAG TPA: DEAD/DEAH box helicase [Trichocoleus sp.]
MPNSANPYVALENIRAKLLKVYQTLPVIEQRMVQLCSVLYAPTRKATIIECLARVQSQLGDFKTPTQNTLKVALDLLLRADMLVAEGGAGVKCNPLLVEIATREAVRTESFEPIVQVIEEKVPIPAAGWSQNVRYFSSFQQFLREIRIGLYRLDSQFVEKQFDDYYRYGFAQKHISLEEIFELVFNNPFDPEWFRSLKQIPEFYEGGLSTLLTSAMLRLEPAEEAFNLLWTDCQNSEGTTSISLRITCVGQLLLRGRLNEAEILLNQLMERSNEAVLYQMWLSFLHGDYPKTIEQGTAALQTLRKSQGKRRAYFNSLPGLFLILALMQEGSAHSLQEAVEYAGIAAKQRDHWLSISYDFLESLLKIFQGDLAHKVYFAIATVPPVDAGHSINTLFAALCSYWGDSDLAQKRLPKLLKPFYEQAQSAGYDWFALEAAELLVLCNARGSYRQEAVALQVKTGIQPVATLVKPKEAWELCLNALINLIPPQPSPTPAQSTNALRLAWFITVYPGSGMWMLQPKEQKLSKTGSWGKGRNIALKRLIEESSSFDYLTPQDRQVCSCLELDTSYGYYGQKQYKFGERAIATLVGHPLVFWEDSPTTRVEIVKGEPELLVQHSKTGWLTLTFAPAITHNNNLILVKETPTRLKVIEVTENHRRVAKIIGSKNQLEVPASAQEQVLAAIHAVSNIVTVHSDIGGGAGAEEVPAETTPHIHLLPAGDGLKVALLARPFPEGGPYYRPGSGGETVIAEINGKRLQTRRNLKKEKTLAAAVVKQSPVLTEWEDEDGEWSIGEPEACLNLLLELQNLGDQVVVEWPEGEKLRVSRQVNINQFKMNIKQQRDWFAASGELQLDDDQVLDIQRLMELLEQFPGRFIKLGEGQFLALTQEFRKRLDDLRAFSEKHGKGVRFHPLAALAMEDWIDEVGDLKTDKHWKTHIQKLRELEHYEPQLPSTLQAELRDYQVDGFRWLARLAHWGVGACLADDMGLGKTLQALALILTRAPQGPTLVIAPTSVCMNWLSEAQKFAPTLNLIQFGSGDRQKLLDGLQPFDLLVCSYGLLQQEELAEKLAEVEWQTIVLDEAQAIKNTTTKRSKAAMNLQGGFKLITTGTPIENNLSELWNLFRFINPGLLGSLERFNQTFANPIERDQDLQARNRLKKLIQPFILRRTKSQVLSELPARTEITLQVELSKAEIAFYEALRREAIAKLTDSEAEAGAKHLQVLAEIMRLRRACCNPRMVMPNSPLGSAKLETFGEVLEELLSNHHKALVFSQFVDHLAILRNYLDERQITYQYLDGSTPALERKKRVDAFQAGQGDVFLISLKAGGTGLNLTAADYVIHMDPWWNPAVEDQASDRAHRIGQQRPVTIYRLVAKDTIEEKIVDLHRQKRDLADSLLEGSDMSGKISTEDLIRLISES